MKRYNPKLDEGLTLKQVKERILNNLVNYDTSIPTKSVKKIISDNFFTLFNFLNLFLAIAIVLVGSYKNLLFMGVVLCNLAISIYQEWHAKIAVDKLSFIASTKVKVIRNKKEEEIDVDKIVLDDIIKLKIGNQVVVDSVIKEGEVLVDESFITGESNQIRKRKGDMLLSGSFIVSGKCIAQVEHVALDNYTSVISHEAKYIKKVNSEIMKTLNKIIKIISIVIIPLGIIQFIHQYQISLSITDSVVNTVASVIGMIPEGLVLLTSTVLAVSIIRLSKRKVLVQELFCIETLARVDTICLDKTGTITEGYLEVKEVINLNKDYDMESILTNLTTTLGNENETMSAISRYYSAEGFWTSSNIIPFSSANKYSGVTYENYGTFIIGAPDILTNDKKVLNLVLEYENYRVLLLARTKKNDLVNKNNLEVIGLIVLEDKIRPSAIKTLNYFKKQGVDVKIISGDSETSVCSIARRVGMKDVRSISLVDKNVEEIEELVNCYDIFCRVSPAQKKIIIKALQMQGHIVAMTGDGVNDVLALKEADCSIALANGSEATRNISQLVLMNSNFDSLPKVVEEGRRTINNIERSASLFLTKTIYATLLSIIFLFVNLSYPFEPIQLSLISSLTIGIPSFVLALEPNKERINGNFFINIIKKSIPAALTIVINIIGVIILSNLFNINEEQTSTMAVILVALTGFMLLFRICYPFNRLRLLLYISLGFVFVVSVFGLHHLFELVMLEPFMFIFIFILCILDVLLFKALIKLCEVKIIKNQERILR